MIINNVRIFPNENAAESEYKATATVVLNNQLILQSIRIMANKNTEDGLRVAYPVQRLNNGTFRPSFYPISAEARAKYDDAILNAYQKVVSGEAPDNTVVYEGGAERAGYKVTSAIVRPSFLFPSSRAKISMTLDDELCLRGLFLVARDNGALFLHMPGRRLPSEKVINFYHPLDQDARNALTGAVLPYYEEAAKDFPERPLIS